MHEPPLGCPRSRRGRPPRVQSVRPNCTRAPGAEPPARSLPGEDRLLEIVDATPEVTVEADPPELQHHRRGRCVEQERAERQLHDRSVALRDVDEPRRVVAGTARRGRSGTPHAPRQGWAPTRRTVQPTSPPATPRTPTVSGSRRAWPSTVDSSRSSPSSSWSSRSAASTTVSPASSRPPGSAHCPACVLRRDARRHRRNEVAPAARPSRARAASSARASTAPPIGPGTSTIATAARFVGRRGRASWRGCAAGWRRSSSAQVSGPKVEAVVSRVSAIPSSCRARYRRRRAGPGARRVVRTRRAAGDRPAHRRPAGGQRLLPVHAAVPRHHRSRARRDPQRPRRGDRRHRVRRTRLAADRPAHRPASPAARR